MDTVGVHISPHMPLLPRLTRARFSGRGQRDVAAQSHIRPGPTAALSPPRWTSAIAPPCLSHAPAIAPRARRARTPTLSPLPPHARAKQRASHVIPHTEHRGRGRSVAPARQLDAAQARSAPLRTHTTSLTAQPPAHRTPRRTRARHLSTAAPLIQFAQHRATHHAAPRPRLSRLLLSSAAASPPTPARAPGCPDRASNRGRAP